MFNDTCLLPLTAARSLELQGPGSCHRMQRLHNDDWKQEKQATNGK
jgi:hypothetical protein